MTQHFDLIAIGGGSGGLSVAERAASYGKKCAVIEPDRLGGTCVNRGCVPKKVMWNAANLIHSFQLASGYGIKASYKSLDWPALVKKREDYIRGINDWYIGYLSDSNITLISGYARFIDKNTIDVNGTQYTADHIAISVGGEPTVPNIPGAELGMTSDGFFQLIQQPKRVAIIGSGYIAVEIAGVLNAMGSDVSLLIRGQQILGKFDALMRDTLTEEMTRQGIRTFLHTQPQSIQQNPEGKLTLQGTTLSDVDAVIWAIGRRPLTNKLNLTSTGIVTDKHGMIPTDEYQNTEVEGLYALGDITGRAALTPVAIAAGRRLADRLFNDMPSRKVDYHNIASVVFSHPPIGTIGLTESEARKKHGDAVNIYTSSFTPMLYSLTDHPQKTAMKLITIGEQEKIVGCHIIGHAADEMLQGFAVAIRMGACKKDFDDTIAIHPTSAEELVTLK